MRTDRAVTRPSSEPVFMRPIVDRQTPVKTLPSLAVSNKQKESHLKKLTMAVRIQGISGIYGVRLRRSGAKSYFLTLPQQA